MSDTCTPTYVANIPGPRGPEGPAGTDGTDGVSAYTTLSASFIMPAEGATVAITVANSDWMVAGMLVFVGKAGSAAAGTFQVASKSAGAAVLTNLEDTASGAYTDNSAPGTVFPAGSTVVSAGLQGPRGTDGTSGAPDDATYILQTADPDLPGAQALDVLTDGILNHVSGIIGITAENTTNGAQAPNDGALTNGDAVFATAAGIQTKTDADARTALGLGTMATQNANNVAITGGTISGVTLPVPSGVPYNLLIFLYQVASTTNGGAFNSGAWRTVPLNLEVVDTGGDGSIAGNTVTLAAGTYRASWRVVGRAVDKFQSRLYNVSTTSVIEYGSNEMAPASDAAQSYSQGEARFTVSAGQQIRLEAQCQTTDLTGFGAANSFGGPETYSSLTLIKEAP